MSLTTLALVVVSATISSFSKLDASNIISVISIMAFALIAILLFIKFNKSKSIPKIPDKPSGINDSLIIGRINNDGSISNINLQNDSFGWIFIDNHWVNKFTSLKFPNTFSCNLQVNSLLSYDESIYNCSIGYQSLDTDFGVTIYLYPTLYENVNQGFDAELSNIANFHLDSKKLSNEQFWGINSNSEDIFQSKLDKSITMSSGFTYTEKNLLVKSYLILTKIETIYIKIRATWPENSPVSSKIPMMFLIKIIEELSSINENDIFGMNTK